MNLPPAKAELRHTSMRPTTNPRHTTNPFTRTLAFLLSAGLLWHPMHACWASAAPAQTEADRVLKRYPNARVFRLTQAEFNRIEPLLNKQAVCETLILAQASTTEQPTVINASTNTASITNSPLVSTNAVVISTNTTTTAAPTAHAQPPSIDYVQEAPLRAESPFDDRTCTGAFDLIGDLGDLDSDAAIVIFIIVGVTVVAAVVVYSAALLYQAATGQGGYTYWWDSELYGATLVGGGDSGTMASLRIGSGAAMENARLGMLIEGGYLDAKIGLDDVEEDVDIEGGFLMGGAGVRWPLNSAANNVSFLGMELLAGKVWDEDVHLISVARATLSIGLGDHARLGFSLGALYLGLDETDTLVEDADNFTTTLGLEAGVRF
jgi:hypothetical protein